MMLPTSDPSPLAPSNAILIFKTPSLLLTNKHPLQERLSNARRKKCNAPTQALPRMNKETQKKTNPPSYNNPTATTATTTPTNPVNEREPALPIADEAFGPLNPSVALTGFCTFVASGTALSPFPISTTCELLVLNLVGASEIMLFSKSYTTYADRRNVSPRTLVPAPAGPMPNLSLIHI